MRVIEKGGRLVLHDYGYRIDVFRTDRDPRWQGVLFTEDTVYFSPADKREDKVIFDDWEQALEWVDERFR